MNEYRWENIRFGQGHYFNATSGKEAIKMALNDATRGRLADDVIIVQQWKPKTPAWKYALIPQKLFGKTKEEIAQYYQTQGYDYSLIRKALENAQGVYMAQVGQSQGSPGRTLTTSEERWATIRHRKSGTVATIIGTHYGSFNVYVPKEDHKLALPFEKVHEWEVLKGDPNQPHTARWFQEDYDGEIRKYSQQHSTYKGAYEHMVGLHNSAQYVGKHFQVISITSG